MLRPRLRFHSCSLSSTLPSFPSLTFKLEKSVLAVSMTLGKTWSHSFTLVTRTSRDCNLRRARTTPPRPKRIMWRHRARDHSIRHMSFPTGSPLEPSLQRSNRFRDIQPQHQRMLTDTLTNERTHVHTHIHITHQQTWRIAIPPGGAEGTIIASNTWNLLPDILQ